MIKLKGGSFAQTYRLTNSIKLKMKGFRFSRDEYRSTYRTLMPSTNILKRTMNVERITDG